MLCRSVDRDGVSAGRLQHVATATLLGVMTVALFAVSPAGALCQGPKSPLTVVNDPSTGTLTWAMPQNAAISDNTYAHISGSFATQYLKATDFGFALPPDAVIEGIQIDFERRGFKVFDNRVRIVRNGVVGGTDRSIPGDWNAFSDVVRTYGGNGDLWGESWTAADINNANFGFAISANVVTGIAFADAISITVFCSLCNSLCGNNQLDAGEDCDDGNLAGGDCCSACCEFEGAGTPCANATVCDGDETCDGAGSCLTGTAPDCDDAELCTQDSCDPISGCVNDGGLVGGCRTALKSLLLLKDKTPDSKDKLVWKWVKGASTTQEELGALTGTTALCVHAGTAAALLTSYNMPADATKWAAIGTKGYQFSDPAGSADGITKVLLKGSTEDKAKCLVKGKADNLPDLDLAELIAPVTVQLLNSTDAMCFESRFEEADVIKFDQATQFKAKAQ